MFGRMAQYILEVEPVHLSGRSENLFEVLPQKFASRFKDKLESLDGRVPVDLVFHAARCCPFQEGKSGIQSLDTAFEVCRLQHASSLISLLLEPVVQCFPHDIHFLPAFIERIFTEAFRQ